VVPTFYRCHRIYLIQDNALYHKTQETYDWFRANRRFIEVFQLPPYFPEFESHRTNLELHAQTRHTQPLLERSQDLCDALLRRFDHVRHHPQEIADLPRPFFELYVELFMRTYMATQL
jgi:hypothetical protein